MRHKEGPQGATSMEAAARSRRLQAVFRDRYRDYQYAYVQFLTEHLVDCSRHFGGDLQKLLVLAVVGQAALHWKRRAGTDHPAFEADAGAVSASRIADLTGIPRQTVRRKLIALEAKGWVEQVGSGSWRIRYIDGEAQARTDFASLDARAIERVARLVSNLSDLER